MLEGYITWNDVKLKVSCIRLFPDFGDYEKHLRTVSNIYYWASYTRGSNGMVLF